MSPTAPVATAPVAPPGSAMRERFDALRAKYPAEMAPSLVMPLLHAVQEAQGFVTDAQAAEIADYLGIPAMQAVEALHWYSMYRREKPGRHVVQVCRNIACALRGAEGLLSALQKELGIAPGQTTPDGRITLETVECLASCGTAPAMCVDGRYHENLDAERVVTLVRELP